MIEKLKNIDVRIIYAIMLVAIVAPMFVPLGLPIRVMSNTQAFYDYIDKLPAGSKVLISYDYGGGSAAELDPMTIAVLKHLLVRAAKIYATASIADGPMFADSTLKTTYEAQGKVYGQDYINLNWFSGGESAIASFAQNFGQVFKNDFTGKPLSQFPMMQGIQGIQNFDLVISINHGPGGQGTPEVWVRQIVTARNKPLMVGCTSGMGASTLPFVQSGQIKGLLIGLRAAAEYETAITAPAVATSYMEAQSTSQLVVLIFVVLGNVVYFSSKKKTN